MVPPAPEPATILAPLAALSEGWPETLRMEIAQLTLTNAQVALPLNLIEPALKRGRVTFTWRNLRSWIKSVPPASSIHDGLELELPLKVIAPLFLARQKAAINTAKPHQSAPLPTEIPNLFFGFPQPQPPYEIPEPPAKAPLPDDAHFAPKPAEAQRSDTNYYIWVESDTTSVAARPSETEFNRTPMPATDFSSRFATPKEVVARAMALKGVAGALVALPDGLMVSSQIPSDLNADTLAAFLPQIYGRVSQCTKELRMGGLNNLNFTVGNVPWKIFRVNGVYFAAFGRAGEQLPTAQLVQLAGELDRKTQ
jgi:predicted regulator of Ras-like GTPase activity (Roadblock/LC7/MglB family)